VTSFGKSAPPTGACLQIQSYRAVRVDRAERRADVVGGQHLALRILPLAWSALDLSMRGLEAVGGVNAGDHAETA